MNDHLDESLLSVSMYLLSRGLSEKSVVELLTHFGWESDLAKSTVKKISTMAPKERAASDPSLKSFVLTWLLFSILIFAVGDYLFVLPSFWLWRIASSLSLAVLIPFLFLSIWFMTSNRIDR